MKSLSILLVKNVKTRPPSQDIDGDGVVGPTDYFVAKTFGKATNHGLSGWMLEIYCFDKLLWDLPENQHL